MTFARWQPRYAEVGIATFPVKSDKTPAVKAWPTIGLRASQILTKRFAKHEAFGFAAGKYSKITVLDIDTPDERVLADALNRYGPTPIVARSGSGNWHAWYRYNGERRLIKQGGSTQIDLLGAGCVIAPPSRLSNGRYEFIEGSLDDVRSLPVMRNVSLPNIRDELIREGQRNNTLFRELLRHAPHCDDIDALRDVASTVVQSMVFPLPTSEIRRTIDSVWKMQLAGRNWVGTGKRIIIPFAEIDTLMMNFPDAFLLKLWLQRYRGALDSFSIANAIREYLPGGSWSLARTQAARRILRELGFIEKLHPDSSYHGPAVYRFSKVRKT